MKVPSNVFLAFCIFTQIIGFTIFLKGFFPIKSAVPGYASWHETPPEPGNGTSEPMFFKSHFGRLVIILVDALRADFVRDKESHMSYTRKLIDQGRTHVFVAHAHPPTVTMPRIKALTTGGIPGFVDVVLNFDSSALQEDNMIGQFHRAGKRIVFYGDDTWIRLFPNYFARHEGTTSFFVTDYTEVDNNVTRHLPDELSNPDWDVLILHYLGLDHIGHLAGPSSPLMPLKLREMDSIVERIHKTAMEWDKSHDLPSLILLCGDHGMSDQGSHGGSSITETATPLVFISSAFKTPGMSDTLQVDQIDLVPTLALMMGVPVPQNSLGRLLSPVFSHFSMREQLRALQINAEQVVRVLKQNVANHKQDLGYQAFEQAHSAHLSWLESLDNPATSEHQTTYTGQKILAKYHSAMKKMVDQIAGSLTTYDLHAMGVGIAILWMTFLANVICLAHAKMSHVLLPSCLVTRFVAGATGAVAMATHVTMCTSPYKSDLLCPANAEMVLALSSIGMFVFGAILTLLLAGILSRVDACCLASVFRLSFLTKFVVTGVVLHVFSLLSSSFVEEEHQTWYFFTITINFVFLGDLLTQLIKDKKDKTLCKTQARTNTGEKTQYADVDGKFYERKPNDTLNLDGNDKKSRYLAPKNIDLTSIYAAVLILCICRLLRSWNHTGMKWNFRPDIGDWLVRPENKPVLSVLVLVSLLLWVVVMAAHHISKMLMFLLFLGACGVYAFRAANGAVQIPGIYEGVTKGIAEARIVYTVILLGFLYTAYNIFKVYKLKNIPINHEKSGPNLLKSVLKRKYQENSDSQRRIKAVIQIWESLFCIWSLLTLLLMRPHNIPMTVFLCIQEMMLSNYILPHIEISIPVLTLVYTWMGQAAFFYQGNSNSLTTVDVSAGYVGLEDFNQLWIGLFMGAATYSGPFIWFLSLMIQIVRRCTHVNQSWHTFKTRYTHSLLEVSFTLLLTRSASTSVYTVLVTMQRYHLFVWSVFSPKLLYQAVDIVVISLWTLGLLWIRLLS